MLNKITYSSSYTQVTPKLLHSGVASVLQLGQTPVYQIHRQILRLQVANLQRQDLCPSVDLVQKWVQEAKTLT